MKSNRRRKQLIFAAVNVGLLTAAIICFVVVHGLTGLLPAQREAERWRGESETKYSQISCFVPELERLSLKDIFDFRYAMLEKLKAASLDVQGEEILFTDAWSTTGKVRVSTQIGRGEASVIAVGGNFFAFHPIRLLNGSYLAENDLMKDRVLLDEELAWLLFGGTDLQGMSLEINGVPFVVAGVIEREQDFASRKAYTAGMGLYMSLEGYQSLDENAGISCYEVVMAEPVKGFGLSVVKEKFPIGQGEIRENSTRYTAGSLLKVVGQFGTRSMQTLGVIYPYWENAARCVEDWSAALQLLGMLLLFLPVGTTAYLAIRYAIIGKTKLEDELLPKWKEKTEEAIRVRQRRLWERTHKD